MTKRIFAVALAATVIASALIAPAAEAKKKRKPKPAPAAPVCATFVPGEAGAGKPTVVLTDAATEAAPVEQTVSLAESVADVTQVTDHGADAFNIQVDTANADAGFYALLEFEPRRDYDLNLYHSDGSYAARSRSWNTFVEITDQPPGISATGHGGESTDHSEKLVGIRTADCAGWTLGAENWLGEGGDLTVKLWLGETKTEPLAPGEETP